MVTPLKAICLGCMTLAALVGGCDRRQTGGGDVIGDIVERFDCDESLPPRTSADTTLTDTEVCSLVAAAIRALGEIPDTPGEPLPGDTALVAGARILAVTEQTFADSLIGSWWIVTLDLPGRTYNVDVRIDQTSGNTEVRRVHKPLGSGPP